MLWSLTKTLLFLQQDARRLYILQSNFMPDSWEYFYLVGIIRHWGMLPPTKRMQLLLNRGGLGHIWKVSCSAWVRMEHLTQLHCCWSCSGTDESDSVPTQAIFRSFKQMVTGSQWDQIPELKLLEMNEWRHEWISSAAKKHSWHLPVHPGPLVPEERLALCYLENK